MRHLNLIRYAGISMVAGCMILTSCTTHYAVIGIEGGRVPMTTLYDKDPDKALGVAQ